MPILPALSPVFEAMSNSPAGADLPVAEARAQLHAMIEASFTALGDDVAPVASEVDHPVEVDGGVISVRVYTPDRDGPLPGHVYFHGGGFWLGTLAQGDGQCRALAADAPCVVVSVDYRLAPEHPFPAAAEDAYAAYLWVTQNAGRLGIDPARISVGGGSAGGNLAAVVSLMARDRGGPLPVFQVLEIPVTDFTTDEPLQVDPEGPALRSGKDTYGAYYLPKADDAANPYASPLLAPDLSGLPPALVMCAEYDPLCPEGMAYAARLAEAGTPVEARMWEGQFHGSQRMSKLIPDEVAEYHAQVVRALRQAYGVS